MKKAGGTILRYVILFLVIGALGFLFTNGLRLIDEHNSMQKTAKIALEDYLSPDQELPVGEYVSYEARWVLGPFATETETRSTNGISATAGVTSYYYLLLGKSEPQSVIALAVQNAEDNKTLEQMSDWLLDVDGYPSNGKTLKVQGKLREMKDLKLRNLYSEDIQSIFGVSPTDSAVQYLVLDTTAGRDGIFLIVAGAAVAVLVIVVIYKKAKKKSAAV